MTILHTSLLSETVLVALTSAGWTGLTGEAGRFAHDLLRCAGVPIGRKGCRLLDEFGGLTIKVTSDDQTKCSSTWAEARSILLGVLGISSFFPKPPIPSSALARDWTRRLSFAADNILKSCIYDPTFFLYNIPYNLGRVMSVIAADWNDRFLLVDEASADAYVLDTAYGNVTAFADVEHAIEKLLQPGPWRAEGRQILCPPADFQPDTRNLQDFIDTDFRGFRFYIHHHTFCHSDRCLVGVFVLSDGTVNGSVSAVETGAPMIPVHLKLEDSEVSALQHAFALAPSSVKHAYRRAFSSFSSVTIGYGVFGRSVYWDVKRLPRPAPGFDRSDKALLWTRVISICDRCVQQAFPEGT